MLVDTSVSNNEGVGRCGPDACEGGEDGGIWNAGALTMTSCVVSDNGTRDSQGGGGIWNTGTLSISDSRVSGNSSADSFGGGIRNKGGELTVTDSTVSGNSAWHGGGIDTSGAAAVLTVTNSVVSGNSADSQGGAIHHWDGGTAVVSESTISGNTATIGGGVLNDGALAIDGSVVSDNVPEGIRNWGTMTAVESSISRNGGESFGSGIWNSGTATVERCTVSGNTARSSVLGAGLWNFGMLALANTTVSSGATREDIRHEGGTLMLNNSTLFGTIFTDVETLSIQTSATIIDGGCVLGSDTLANTSLGHNIESPGNTCGFDQTGDQVDVTAEELNLGELADNGGPTMTHALGPGSFAIDWIPVIDCVDADGAPLTTDQRGVTRPQGTMCDVGAFEVQP